MAPSTASKLLVQTVQELSSRAPAIVAAAARQLDGIVLGLHFGDGSHAVLEPNHSRLLARSERATEPDVEVYFDNRTLNLLFDLERRPVDQILDASLDVRGERDQVLAVWRTFQLLSQRASGLRAVQGLWRAYRDQIPELWGRDPGTQGLSRARTDSTAAVDTGWGALDFLDHRHPEDIDGKPEAVAGEVIRHSRTLWDGRNSTPWWEPPEVFDNDLMETLQKCGALTRAELERIIPNREPRAELYDLMHKYPERGGKALRPTLTIASCCAFGGAPQDGVRAAAAIELFHNGFLVHDDIADESTHRRNQPTLHESHGVGLAVNTGDAMNLLAVDTVLSNLPTLGLSRTLGLIHEILHMCRETVEGQAIELGWIQQRVVPARDEDYFLMSTKKTGWYTSISPCRLGAVCAGETDPRRLDGFNEAFRLIGIAFQIQDDILNLVGEEALYGKEPLGDLLEGKRTLMMIHLLREADAKTRRWVEESLATPRAEKRFEDAERILEAMKRVGSIPYAEGVADRLAHQGVERFEADLAFLPDSEAKAVLRQVAHYVTTRHL